MGKKIVVILLACFFVINTGFVINSSGREQMLSQKTERIPLNDVYLEPIENNEEKLSQIEQEPLTTITSSKKGDCAVIIKQFLPHSLGTCMKNTCKYAINKLQNRNYVNILFVESPTLNKLSNDMIDFIENNIGGQKRLFFYLTAHGSSLGNNGMVQINPFQMLSDDRFASYIDSVSSYYSVCTVVMESCEVGSFIDDLGGPNRIIISATDSDSSSYGEPFGLSPFSEKIFSSYGAGNSLKTAWEEADKYICNNRFFYDGQNPQLDDNGNGYSVGNYREEDKLPMDDGHTPDPNNWDGNLAKGNKVKSKQNIETQKSIKQPLLNKMMGIINRCKSIFSQEILKELLGI